MRYGAALTSALLAVCVSCSYFKKKEASSPPIIRYMNLKAVYNFVVSRNRDALDVRKKLDEKTARMKDVERQLDMPATDHVALLDEYRQLYSELAALKTKSKSHKADILNQIDRAVKNVSKTAKADFVYNIGDELIYAKKEYDITEDILREIVRLGDRKTPESR